MGCQSSGVKTASAAIISGQCKLVSIHAVITGTKPTTIKVFDNASAASGKELSRMILARSDASDPTALTGPESIEFDMHEVICKKRIIFEHFIGYWRRCGSISGVFLR